MKKVSLRTVRCILKQADRYFLVMHHNRVFSGPRRWGFPGGRIEQGEPLATALTRELREELYISLTDFTEVGDYRYKGYHHKIFAAAYADPIIRFDRNEIHKVGWHTLEDIRKLRDKKLLHTGFELEAIADFEALHQG